MGENMKHMSKMFYFCSYRCVYDVYLEPQYENDVIGPEPQKGQVLIPGSPDPAEIWMRSAARDEFIIEWGEPSLWGVRVQGYQVRLIPY